MNWSRWSAACGITTVVVGLALALSSAVATAGDVGVISTGEPNEACIAAGTAVPRILDGGPWLNHPGDRKTQFFAAEADYRPLPEECAAAFNRKAEIRFQVQSPEKHSRWIDANGYEIPVKPRQVQKEELEQLEQEREAQGRVAGSRYPAAKKASAGSISTSATTVEWRKSSSVRRGGFTNRAMPGTIRVSTAAPRGRA